MTGIAVVGIGRWGRNLLREFSKISTVTMCCHKESTETENWLKENYPQVKRSTDIDDALNDSSTDAVAIATPNDTHFELAHKSLSAGKNVFVEKPLATKVSDAEKLIELAKRTGLKLFVGHVFLYHPVLSEIKNIIQNDPVKYARFSWNKFGTFDEDIVWNLASHEVAIAFELFQAKPISVNLLDERGVISKRDFLSVKLNFDRDRECVIDINRICPSKNKSVTVVTSKERVLLWQNEVLFELNKNKNSFERIYQPEITPLEVECKEFIECLDKNKQPRTDGNFGLEVVGVLEKLV